MKEEKKIINKLKQKTKNNQKLACGCGYYSCDRAFLMGFYNYASTNDGCEKNNLLLREMIVISCHYKGTDS